ncbi:hypothetical protein MGG_09649 [Pyricularia oryzae 70-15]|uniref:NAD(P)-binding domain-containing protein n=2 Tax=Pyricularia oryzae TaxID=318829 RepID=G4NL03_PYRO7|nr:uncharacterized protein MGG_09649 [Pyricularia oryzae 70-15]EHA46693.1 hypothetical protein MGG_09649 [Pyricularia oryzae 70-15]ELQ39650.1 hypothetical protein OOU_Y34scaffold00489g4 [Pyricularia oryzae Y34]KAI7912523.1 hypothetical protein M0657_010423 [Pyricularia oryzae]KAI7917143.1 hypothetical protein M9X92_007539 [Pyricularia oryzae]
MATATNGIPVLCTGQSERVGQPVATALLPELSVVHFTLVEHVDKEMPLLLKGERPSPLNNSVVTPGKWEPGSNPPAAVLLGGAYTDEMVRALRASAGYGPDDDGAATTASSPAGRKIPWIKIDSAKSTLGPRDPGYPADVVRRLKGAVLKLQAEGKLDGVHGGLYAV